jgi:hypothetical protein
MDRLSRLPVVWAQYLFAFPVFAALSVIASITLRVVALRSFVKILDRLRPFAGQFCGLPTSGIIDVADFTSRLTHGSDRCLMRSLILYWALRPSEGPVTIVLGVRKRHSLFESHAWVEVNGKILADEPTATTSFNPLYRFSGP